MTYNKDELLDKYGLNYGQISTQNAVDILSQLKANISEQLAVAISIAQEFDLKWSIEFEAVEGVRYGHNQASDPTYWNASSSYC